MVVVYIGAGFYRQKDKSDTQKTRNCETSALDVSVLDRSGRMSVVRGISLVEKL
jgi:hypothetical protein